VFKNMSPKYKKSWVINTSIARELAGFSGGDKLPTIQEFTQKLHSSRGIVQKALEELQKGGGIVLEKRGKMGTYIGALNRELLFRLGGLESVTATMPSPVTKEFAGLATGICDAMQRCPVPFNFAFIHGAATRGAALSRMTYDFAITSCASAKSLTARYPDLDMILPLDGCVYSPPFVLCGNRPGVRALFDGAVIAVDPNSLDHFYLTKRLCGEKKVRMVERPYITCRALFLSGEVDFLVFRDMGWKDHPAIETIPLEGGEHRDYTLPAVLISKKNYHMGTILKSLLIPETVAEGQAAVLEGRREVQYY
jgi:DNA-binding transcriptional regulator YhcF (GntR family)